MTTRRLLNADLDFDAFPPTTKAAFTGVPRKHQFSAGEMLFRFASLPEDGFAGNQIFGSPWWVPRHTFSALVRLSHRTKQPLPAAARARLAVNKGWSPTMEYVAVIELTDSVFGWVGTTSPQPLDGTDRSVLLLGHY